MRVLGDQPGALKDGNVLLYCSERHVVTAGQRGDTDFTDQGAGQDVSTCPVGEGPEDAVNLVVSERAWDPLIYNHQVVR